MLDFLQAAVACRLNVIVSGGTGAGKTTLLNVLSSFISDSERVVTIEDAAELMLRQRHVVRLETRPANIEGKGAVRQRQLVVNALRMRPDRIIVGEVRGEEALDMLQAMNTGHDGSLTTIHANSPRDALYRLDTMVAMANLNIPERAVRQQIASAVNIIVQVSRMSDGTRKVTAISEITGMEQDVITMQDIFVFERTGHGPGRQGDRPVPRDRHPAEVRRAARDDGHPAADRHVRARAAGGLRADADVAMVIMLRRRHVRPRRRHRLRRCTGCSSCAKTPRAARAAEAAEAADARRASITAALLKALERLSGVGALDSAARAAWAASPARCSATITQAGLKMTVGTILLASACSAGSGVRRGHAVSAHAARRLGGAVLRCAFLPFALRADDAQPAAAQVRGAVSRGDRSDRPGAARRPRVHDRAGDGRRGDPRAGRAGVPAAVRPAELRHAAAGGAESVCASACRSSTRGSSSPRC